MHDGALELLLYFIALYYYVDAPVITEHGVIKNDLFQQLNQFIRQIGRHESLHSD